MGADGGQAKETGEELPLTAARAAAEQAFEEG